MNARLFDAPYRDDTQVVPYSLITTLSSRARTVPRRRDVPVERLRLTLHRPFAQHRLRRDRGVRQPAALSRGRLRLPEARIVRHETCLIDFEIGHKLAARTLVAIDRLAEAAIHLG